MEQLDVRFRKLWRDLSLANDPADAFRWLKYRYSENRHYHTLDHIAYGLDMIDNISEPFRDQFPGDGLMTNLVRFAFWYHDTLSNESRSADAARIVLWLGRKQEVANIVGALIEVTSHQTEPTEFWKKVIVDADLAILGADRDKFDEYEIGVRKEYANIPDTVYAVERVKILNSFLTRKSIYYTLYCQRELEEKARENLRYSIERLLCSIR